MSDMNNLDGHERDPCARMSRWPLLLVIGLMLLVPPLFIAVNSASAHMFLNSAEPQCNGSDPTVLMCDDFEDGTWYVTNADTAGGRSNPLNNGWWGSIYHTDPLQQSYGRCGQKGAVGTNCTSTSTWRSGGAAQGQAFHLLGPQVVTGYDEIYHRVYIKFSADYEFGHEKLIFYQADANNASTQILLINTPFGSPCFDIHAWKDDIRVAQNQGTPFCFLPGHWHYFEVHLKLNPVGSKTGLVEIWADDCGTDGLSCTGSGTLRLRVNTLNLRTAAIKCCDFHQENWCPVSGNKPCKGEVYNDQVVVATRRVGPIRSASGDTTSPAMPTGAKITVP
jgi:hypothetical protein